MKLKTKIYHQQRQCIRQSGKDENGLNILYYRLVRFVQVQYIRVMFCVFLNPYLFERLTGIILDKMIRCLEFVSQ